MFDVFFLCAVCCEGVAVADGEGARAGGGRFHSQLFDVVVVGAMLTFLISFRSNQQQPPPPP